MYKLNDNLIINEKYIVNVQKVYDKYLIALSDGRKIQITEQQYNELKERI